MNGLEFSDAWSRRLMAEVQTEDNELEVPLLALQDLIVNKKATARHKDLDDIEHLKDPR